MPSSLPVFASKFVTGVGTTSDKAPVQAPRYDWSEALEFAWQEDSHTHGYSRASTPYDGFRYNMAALSQVQASGDELLMDFMFVDVDNPDHTKWETEEEQYAALAHCLALPGIYADWCAWYATRGGYRLVYRCATPYLVVEHEARYFGMSRDLALLGVQADEICHDWTRLYRMPRVVRDGVANDSSIVYLQKDRVFNAQAIESVVHNVAVRAMAGHEMHVRSQPGLQEFQYLLEDVVGQPTTWLRYARQALSNKNCFRHIFDFVPVPPGGRDAALMQFVGEVISATGKRNHGEDATTPEHVFALLEGVADGLEPDQDTSDWRWELWRKVKYAWSNHEARQAELAEFRQVELEERVTLVDRTTAAMREWCHVPMLHDDDPEVSKAFMSRHAIVATAGSDAYHILRPDGLYTSMSFSSTMLIAGIAQIGSEALIPYDVVTINNKGEEQDTRLRPSRLIEDHAIACRKIEGLFFNEVGARVRGLGSAAPVLQICEYKRSPVAAKFHKEVDEWLQVMFGDAYGWVCNWLGCALAVEEGPVCALSLKGPANTGKSLLVLALRECFTGNTNAGAGIFEQWSEPLMDSPLVVLNEGLPVKPGSAPSELFRCLVAGDPIQVARKFRASVELRVPMRVIMTANNDTLVQSLVAPKGLTPEDRKAVLDRLTHIELPQAAGDYFEKRGGRALTARPGKEWVGKDNGSRGIIAEHLFWLYEHRKPEKGRMLIHGLPSEALHETLTASAGNASIVHEALLDCIASSTGESVSQGVMFSAEGDYILTTTRGILAKIRMGTYQAGKITQGQVTQALRNLCRETHNRPTRWPVVTVGAGTPKTTHTKPLRFYCVPVEWAYRTASAMGVEATVTKLDQLRSELKLEPLGVEA